MRTIVIFATLLTAVIARSEIGGKVRRQVNNYSGQGGGRNYYGSSSNQGYNGGGRSSGGSVTYDRPQVIDIGRSSGRNFNAPSSRSNVPNYPQNEEKTIIYVLSKKNDGPRQNREFQTPPPPIISKPEVFFIKYNTKQEADQAVSKIQESFRDGGPGYNSPASFARNQG